MEDETRIGLFAVRLPEMSLKVFMLLRKMVPRKDYILIKNRISARHNRTRKKDLLNELKHRNSKLLTENQRLKRLMAEYKRRHEESLGGVGFHQALPASYINNAHVEGYSKPPREAVEKDALSSADSSVTTALSSAPAHQF